MSNEHSMNETIAQPAGSQLAASVPAEGAARADEACPADGEAPHGSSASGSNAQSGSSETVFRDALFRQKRKKGKWREVAAPEPLGPVADTHAHVQMLPDPTLAFAQAAVHGVTFVCDIVDVFEDGPEPFDSMEGWLAGVPTVAEEISGRVLPAPRVRFAVGCHPHNAKDYDDALEAVLRDRLRDPRVAAVGEIGLDYHYDLSPRETQREVFRRQIRLAAELGFPVALHIREAHDEALAILREEGFPPAGTLLHCFNLDWEVLQPWVEEGCFVALGGPLTFKKSDYTREAATHVPLNRLLTETDSPYMTPEPMRGATCTPAHTVFTADCLARLRCEALGEDPASVARACYENAIALLDREPLPCQCDGASV